MPTLNEQDYIDKSLSSLRIQSQGCDLIVADSGSTDDTVKIAKRYTENILKVPKGKLTARDAAIRNSAADIIIAVDADTYYPIDWIRKTVQHFAKSDVVGVTGPRIHDNPDYALFGAANCLFWRFYGSNSAFRKKAYIDSGGFDLSINQRNSDAMVQEEEINFKNRLMQFGKVIFDYGAVCITSARRFDMKNKEYSKQVGLSRF